MEKFIKDKISNAMVPLLTANNDSYAFDPMVESFKTFKDIVDKGLLTSEAMTLINLEDKVPKSISVDSTLRIKVTDICGHACVFCHNEGTLVNDAQAKHRVSIFLPPQGTLPSSNESSSFRGFKVEQIQVDSTFESEIKRSVTTFGTDEVHLTGGEPTKHEKLTDIIQLLTNMGLKVKMTSNGETGGGIYKRLAEAGLVSVNMSIFGSTPEEYAATQPAEYGIKWAKKKLAYSKQAIYAAKENGVDVKSNCVMSEEKDAERIMRLIERANEEGFDLRILNDLGNGQKSIAAIYNLLARIGAVPTLRNIVIGSSGASTNFTLPSGQEIGYKQIRKERLAHLCNGCKLDASGNCEEGFYGLRLYKKEGDVFDGNSYMIGACIQRMDLALPSDEFYSSTYPDEINKLKEKEYRFLMS